MEVCDRYSILDDLLTTLFLCIGVQARTAKQNDQDTEEVADPDDEPMEE